jgi:hypothetical protein
MSLRGLCAMVLAAGCAALANGCASNGSGSVHGSVYYGAGWHDPYYGYPHGYYGGAVVVPNPPDRPDRPDRPSAGQPRPTPLPAAAPTSRPSIPSTPRPRGGGGRRR